MFKSEVIGLMSVADFLAIEAVISALGFKVSIPDGGITV
jgi:hypothetical protein